MCGKNKQAKMSAPCRPNMQPSTHLTTALCNPDLGHDLWLFELEIGTPVIPALGNVYTNFGFSMPSCFWVRSPYGTDRQRNRQARPVVRPTRAHAWQYWKRNINCMYELEIWSIMSCHRSKTVQSVPRTWNAYDINNNPDEIGQDNYICNHTKKLLSHRTASKYTICIRR